jgi:hypothetical protein
MALIKQVDGWVPVGMHGVIVLPTGADIEETITAALRALLPRGQATWYEDIKYRIETEFTVADENGITTKVRETQSILFELI